MYRHWSLKPWLRPSEPWPANNFVCAWRKLCHVKKHHIIEPSSRRIQRHHSASNRTRRFFKTLREVTSPGGWGPTEERRRLVRQKPPASRKFYGHRTPRLTPGRMEDAPRPAMCPGTAESPSSATIDTTGPHSPPWTALPCVSRKWDGVLGGLL